MGIHERFLADTAQCLASRVDREKRYPVAASTIVTTITGASATARILNVSNRGCRIETSLLLQHRDCVRLVLEPLGLVEAEVRWTNEDQAGLKLIARDSTHSDYRFSYPP